MNQPTDKHREEARGEFNAYILEIRERIKNLADGYSTYSGKRGAIRDVLTVIDSFVPDVALSSRDSEIREVLEGLANGTHPPCWCQPNVIGGHEDACLAAWGLWNVVIGKEHEDGDTQPTP